MSVFARSVQWIMLEESFIQYEKEMRALANRRRLKIIFMLRREKHLCVIGIAEKLGVSFRTASKHARILFNVGFLTRSQVNNEMQYSIASKLSNRLEDIVKYL